jgi:hypothetical protein
VFKRIVIINACDTVKKLAICGKLVRMTIARIAATRNGQIPLKSIRMRNEMRREDVDMVLAYWSKDRRIGNRTPQRETCSETLGAPAAPKRMASNDLS